jgi:hypothetical protein
MPYTFQSETSDIVEVRHSNINNAGDGLFALRDIEEGEHMCLYFGVLVFKTQVYEGYYESDYLLMSESSDLIIDAADPKSCLGRFANDSLSLKLDNSDFGFYDSPFSGYIYATRDIGAGEEIYTSYGDSYWADAKKKKQTIYTALPRRDKDFINQVLLKKRTGAKTKTKGARKVKAKTAKTKN